MASHVSWMVKYYWLVNGICSSCNYYWMKEYFLCFLLTPWVWCKKFDNPINNFKKGVINFFQDINLGFSLVIMVFLTRSHERGAEWVSEEALFNSGLSVCPLNAKVHYNVAISALSKGNATKAIKEYREAIRWYWGKLYNILHQGIILYIFFYRLYPDYYQALNNLANILKNEGQLNEAEILLEKALSINGEFPAAWMNLGVVLAQKKEFQRAEESYLKALKFKKKYPDCYYNLGKLVNICYLRLISNWIQLFKLYYWSSFVRNTSQCYQYLSVLRKFI